jgi:Carbonic anhydrase
MISGSQETLPPTPPQEGQEPFPRFTAQTPITTLLERNRAWADRQEHQNPLLFPTLAHSQHPHVLWIGCSDSRVPETTVLDLLPGDLFVHRNIANVVSGGDLSVLSVVQFAVEMLRVNHIVVCGVFCFIDKTNDRTLWMWRMYRCIGE